MKCKHTFLVESKSEDIPRDPANPFDGVHYTVVYYCSKCLDREEKHFLKDGSEYKKK